jgi:GT2 family glycosyltransferase
LAAGLARRYLLTMTLRASVVIPTRNRRDSLERALNALARQATPPQEFEVVVSVDGSEDGTQEMVEAFAGPFALRAVSPAGRGRAAACNAGASTARASLLVLLDDDMEPAPGFLAAHLAAHPDGSRRGVVGGVPISIGRSSPPVVVFIGSKFNGHLERLARPGYRMTFRDFYSGNFSIARELFLEVGGFDEEFRVYGNEDGELALRLLKAGVELHYSAAANAEQHYDKDFAALARDNIAKGRTAVLLSRKWPDALSDLKFANRGRDSRKWRFARAGLVALSRIVPGTPEAVIGLVERLERRRPPRLDVYYRFALDYFYRLGARRALAAPSEGLPPVSPLPPDRGRGPNRHPLHG